MGTQMTAQAMPATGAPSAHKLTWDTIDWPPANANVRRLQMRIAKAYREGQPGRVKALQWLLTHSRSAKLLAVKRVTENRGSKTPGVDNVVWRTAHQKMKAVTSLKRHGYQPQPLRRIYIPKKQAGKCRPLSIPTLACRAQQALYLMGLEPVAEMMSDKHAYGFRPYRSTADAIEQCVLSLAQKGSSQFILEGDIKSCFDTISHSWLLNHVPMDKAMLAKWLTAGYIENDSLYPTDCGTPQGGIISPSLLVITLSGLEAVVKAVTHARRDKAHLCTYADDFIITGATPEILAETIRPAVESFLAERGLVLSQTKTRITHIEEGFDFLGVNIRKYKGKLLCKPAKPNLLAFLKDIRHTIKSNATAKTENLIRILNPKIRGWANYHCHNSAKRTFLKVSRHIFESLWQWAKRRHPEKGIAWIRRKYFRSKGNRHWVFFATIKGPTGKKTPLDLVEIGRTPIRRHIKIRAEATPYDPAYQEYLATRQARRKDKRLFLPCKSSWSPWWEIESSNGE
jgi:RNA-directed DNA polymerase